MYQEDPDEIQEVVPVKEEPRQHHQVAMEEQQQEVIDNSGAMEQYGAEGDYGEYEGYEGEYDQGGMGDASMVGGDGNKDLDAALESMIIRNEDGSFSCGNCGKTMQRKKDLKRHVEVHLDAFHQCHICQKVSKTRSALAMHYSSTHKDMVSSPWSMK